MDKTTLDLLIGMRDAIQTINELDYDFKNNYWISICSPNNKDELCISEPLWSDLKEFLKQKKEDYEKYIKSL